MDKILRRTRFLATGLLTCLLMVPNAREAAIGGSNPFMSLETNAGVRAVAAGGAFVSLANDNSAIFYNPAGLSLLGANTNYVGLQYMTDPLFLGSHYVHSSYVLPRTGMGVFGAGLIMRRFSGLESYDITGAYVGEFAANEMVTGVSHSYNLYPWLSIGETLKVGYLGYNYASASSLALDVGALSRINKKFAFGLSLKNIISTPYTLGVEQEIQPFAIRLGPTVSFLKNKGHLTYDLEYVPALHSEGSGEVGNHIGFTYDIYKRYISLKLGYNGEDFTAGLGSQFSRYQMDVAFARSDIGLSTSLGFHMSLTGIGSRTKFDPTIPPEEFGSNNPVNIELENYYQGMNGYSSGLKAHSEGDSDEAKDYFRKALKHFEKTLEVNPDHALAAEYRGRCLTWLKGGIPLQQEEKQLIEIHRKLAKQYFEKERYGDCIYEWQQVLNLDPGDFEAKKEKARVIKLVRSQVLAYYNQGKQNYAKNDKAAALDSFNAALALNPEHKPSLDWVTKIRSEFNEREKAERARIEKLQKAEVAYGRGLSYYGRNSLKLAIESFQACLKLNPKHQRAQEYLALARQEQKAKKSGLKNLKVAKARHAKGTVHMKEGNFAKAILEFKAALSAYANYAPSLRGLNQAREKLKNRVQPLIAEGRQAYRNKEMALALEKFVLAEAIDPKNKVAVDYITRIRQEIASTIKFHMGEGKKALQGEQYSTAIGHFKNVLNLNSEHKEAKKLLLQAQNQVKGRTDDLHEDALEAYEERDFAAAIAGWEAALKVDPAHTLSLKYLPLAKEAQKASQNKQLVRAWIYEGDTYFANRDYARALTRYQKVLTVQPDNEEVKKKIEKAREEQAAEKKKEKVSQYFLAGIKSYRKKDYDAAISSWKQVIALEPGNRLVARYIKNAEEAKKTAKIKDFIEGKKAYAAGKYASALVFFQRALKVDPGNDDAEDYLERTRDKMREELDKYIRQGKAALRESEYNTAIEKYSLAKRNALSQKDQARLTQKIEDFYKAIEYKEQARQKLSEGGDSLVVAIGLFSKVQLINSFDNDAQKGIDEAVARGKDQVEKWLEEAENLFDDEKYKDAENLYLGIMKIQPGNKTARKGLVACRKKLKNLADEETDKGDEAMDQNNYSVAMRAYKKSLEILEDEDVREKLAKAREALLARKAAAAAGAGRAAARKGMAIINSGMALYRQGKYREAINVWSRVPKGSPMYGKARGYIARAKLKL